MHLKNRFLRVGDRMLNPRWLLSSAIVASVLYRFCAAAQGANCTGTMGEVEVRGNLDIAARCQLTRTNVRGNVTLFSGGSLIARDVSIRGNLTARRADFVAIEGGDIDGNVTLEELVGDNSSIENTEIRGNVTLTSNRSAFEILNNEIDGNVRASGNTGGVSISGNSIGGNLECSDNTPAPVGLGNLVDKRSQGQCQNLRPQESNPPPSPSPPAPPRRNTGAATNAIIPAADIGPSANDQSHDFRATINVPAGFGDTVAGNPRNARQRHDAAYAHTARRTERSSHDRFTLRGRRCHGDGFHRRRPDVADRGREPREHRPARHVHDHLLGQRSVRQCRDARDAHGHRGTAARRRRGWRRRGRLAVCVAAATARRSIPDSTCEKERL